MADPFATPPDEVLRFFRAKGLKPTGHWLEMGFDEHAVAHTVARSAGYDILADTHAAIDEALTRREDFEVFRDKLKPTLQAKGWWGEKEVTDPVTGETKLVKLGSTRRLRTIYWANTRTAYGAGQWERAQRTKRALPYFIYVISTAEHKRPLHLTWVGTIVLVDSPWASTHYPPSAWGCMCRFRQISEWEARQLGYDPDAPPPDEGLTYNYVNKKTGEVSRVPLGVDPGWGTNPGKTRMENVSKLLEGKLDQMDDATRAIAATDLRGSWLARRIASGDIPYDPASADVANLARGKLSVPVAVLSDAQAKSLGASSRVISLSVAEAARLRDLPEGWMGALQTAIEEDRIEKGGAGLLAVEIGGRSILIAGDGAGGLRVTGADARSGE